MSDNLTLRRKIKDTESRIVVLGERLNELRKECELTELKKKEWRLKRINNSMKKYGVKTVPSEKLIKSIIIILEQNPNGLDYFEISQQTGYAIPGISLASSCLERDGKLKKVFNRVGKLRIDKVMLSKFANAKASESQGGKNDTI